MEFRWKEGDEVKGTLYIGKVSDAEEKRVAAIAVTAFRVAGSIKINGKRKWLLEPLELCCVEDSGNNLKFTKEWENNGIGRTKRRASKQKAFMKMIGRFGADPKVGSHGSLISDFFEDKLIELKDNMIIDFDVPASILDGDVCLGAIRPIRNKYEYISERPYKEKGIWQFAAISTYKKDEDERLQQMEHIARMGQLMLDNNSKNEQKKIQSLN